MNITLLKYPTDEDWAFAKQCALVTIGKEMKTAWNTNAYIEAVEAWNRRVNDD